MFIESVMDNIKDGISLDYLARLLVDVHQVQLKVHRLKTALTLRLWDLQDSSRVTDSFVAKYQVPLM
jgi:hypothetical protein